MRTVNSHLLEDKMDDPVTHYINHGTDPHQQGEVPVDAHGLSLNVQEDGTGRVVTVMQSQNFPQICRQISVGEQTEGAWPEDLADAEGRLAALVAHLSRQNTQPKIQHVRSEVDTSVILDTPMRLFQGQTLHDHQTESIVVQVPSLPPFPPLQNMKRCSEPEWYKEKPAHRPESPILDEQVLALGSPAHKLTSKKSLPHKKRISRKLKRNTGNCTPQQVSEEIVVINCAEDIRQEEILPDTFVSHPEHLDEHHMVRAIFICQLCGLFFADEQLKFYSHLKQHYEPHDLLLQPELPADKITNTCIVDNSSALPDSIVELSLENSVPKGMYHDKHILYSHSDKINYNKVQYTMEKEPSVNGDMVKSDLYETFDKLDLYCCVKCNKSFRKQKHCEAHIKEVHSNSKLEDMSEFSEPEDLMEGIHVCVSDGEPYEAGLLPTLTVENGHVHQGGRHWYSRSNTNTVNQCVNDGYCPMCEPQPTIVANSHAANAGPTVEPTAVPTAVPTPANESRENDGVHLKEEVLQRIFEPQYTESILPTPALDPAPPAPTATGDKQRGKEGKKGDDSLKRFECVQCGKVFLHRNSLIYHILSHKERTQRCKDCGKAFYTLSALRIHRRVHNGDKPYKCDDCGRAFRQWSDLKYHRSSIHSTQKNFKCDFCGKEFARKYSLNVHRRIHTGEKNYPCEFCGKTFRASSYRLSHMRTHTGDKPYKCAECLKCFRVAGDLKRHSLIHDKFRNRIEEQQKKIATKTNDKNHIKLEEDSPEPKDGKDTKKKPAKRSQIKKISAPNVTVNKTGELQFKLADYSNSVEVYDTRQDAYQPYTKSDSVKDNLSEFTLKTEYRNAAENSDGKLHIYTHVEKSEGPVSLTDMKDLRTELHGEPIENGFFAKLTALYNITTD